MTTILISRDMIGWDSHMEFGNERHVCPTSKVLVNAMGVWASAGAVSVAEKARKIISEGLELPATEGFMDIASGADGDFELVRVWQDKDTGKTHVRFWSPAMPYGAEPPLPFAMGSGASFVLGAYYGSDQSVVKAMKLVVEHDCASGGDTHVASFPELVEKHVKARDAREKSINI